MLRQAGGDSLLKAVNGQIVKSVRVDSLDAPYLCRVMRVRALLSVRVEQFEKREMEFNQSGKPITTVNLRAALVDSTGRLLWTASGAENAEGPYHDANSGAIGVNAARKCTDDFTARICCSVGSIPCDRKTSRSVG